MEKTIEIPKGYEARIEGNKVILEPKESEDERIRNVLVKLLKVPRKEIFEHEGITKEQALAYLEKQKDEAQKQFNLGVQAGREEVLYEMEKEQKPIQDKEEGEYVRTLKSLISDFLRGKNEIDRGYYQKIYDWLDGRHIEQKSTEWSEEDEKMLTEIINSVNGFDAFTGIILQNSEQHERKINWLKSLRLKPHWKPSQEQSEVDLEKEIEKYFYDNFAFISSAHTPTKDIVSDIANHFYEFGLNARK